LLDLICGWLSPLGVPIRVAVSRVMIVLSVGYTWGQLDTEVLSDLIQPRIGGGGRLRIEGTETEFSFGARMVLPTDSSPYCRWDILARLVQGPSELI
jgi:hypothetical protein